MKSVLGFILGVLFIGIFVGNTLSLIDVQIKKSNDLKPTTDCFIAVSASLIAGIIFLSIAVKFLPP